MIKSLNVCYRNKDDLTAIREEASSYPPENILIQVFTGVLDQDVIRRLLMDIGEVFPQSAVIGTSTAGEIMDAGHLEQSIVVNVSLFRHTRVKSVLIDQNDDLVRAGHEIGQVLKHKDAKAVIVFGCGIKAGRFVNSEPLLAAIQSELEGVIIAGGQAGDNGMGKSTFVFTEKGITENGVAAASLAGSKLMVNNTYNLSWIPIGKKLTITRAVGPRVYSIDNQTPYEIYSHYLGQEAAENLPLSAVDFPLIIEREGVPMAIHAIDVNEDGSFNYIHNFHAGEQVRFGFCHAGLLALGARMTYEELYSHNAQVFYIYSCVSRKWVLGADIAVELSSTVDLASSAGFFSYGEYFYRDTGKAYLFSQTMTVLSLAETDGDFTTKIREKEAFKYMDEDSRQFRTLQVLHRLVETSAKEIESMNQELASLARKDSLTGLANRRRFDEMLQKEMKRLSRSGNVLSLIMLDVDYFKKYNDAYGHVSGDDCLRGLAQVIRETVKRPSDVAARYGGEEFACILPETDHQGALKLAEEMRTAVEKLDFPHSESEIADHVTVSVGVLTVYCDKADLPQQIVETCDELLYQAKKLGRNRVAARNMAGLKDDHC